MLDGSNLLLHLFANPATELDRVAAIKDIRHQQKNPTLFLGQHPEEPEQMLWRLDFWAIAQSELEATFQKSNG